MGIGEIRICELCGSRDKVAIHHENRNHSDNTSSNLRFLCNSCHAKEHIIDSGAGKHEQAFTLIDYFSRSNEGYRLTKGMATFCRNWE